MNNEKITPEEEAHYLHQYERMQDMVANYATLAIKTIAIVSSGALVSIGAAFINFLSLKGSTNHDAFILVKNGLANSFTLFSYSLLITLINLLIIYIARSSFLIGCDTRFSAKIRYRHDLYGAIFETIALMLYVLTFILFGCGLFNLAHIFENYSAN